MSKPFLLHNDMQAQYITSEILAVHLSVCPSVCLSVRLSVCLSAKHVLCDKKERIYFLQHIDKHEFAIGIYLGLQKAFDTANYDIVLYKLHFLHIFLINV